MKKHVFIGFENFFCVVLLKVHGLYSIFSIRPFEDLLNFYIDADDLRNCSVSTRLDVEDLLRILKIFCN